LPLSARGLTPCEPAAYVPPMNGPVLLDPPRTVGWQQAAIFAEMNQDMASPNPNPIEELWPWFKGVKAYQQAEMGGAPTEADRRMQKHMLSVLINLGEWLVRELRQHDVSANAGVKLADVEATLETLYESLRVSFGGMTEARRTQVLDEVFGAP
jgi:hypothetical protein